MFTFLSLNFSKYLLKQNGLTAKIVIGVILGVLAIYSTFMGTKLVDGTIINVRELTTMIAGVAGGQLPG